MIRIFHHYISVAFITLFIVEYSVFFAAMYFGSEFRFMLAKSWYSEEYIILASFVFASVQSICLASIGLYRRNLEHDDYELLSRTAVSFSLSIFIIVCIYYLFPQFIIARSVLAHALSFAFLGMTATRHIFKILTKQKSLKKKILLIGCGNNANKIIQSNTGYIHEGFEIAGCFATKDEPAIVDSRPIIHLPEKNISDFIKTHNIEEIVIALDDRKQTIPLNALLNCKMNGIETLTLLSFYEREKAFIDLDNLYPSWMLFSDGFTKSGIRTLVKRVIDIIASLTLLSLTFPIMLLAALAISIESGFGAPIFYRQTRVGKNNKNFDVLKFRSMVTDAEKQSAQFATANDSRVTRVGGFIRKYRIDELPQIFNVLKSDMSFVGPRPERPEFVNKFNQSIPYYEERHRIKPGITGWAQLCYPYGENEYDATQKLQYDLYYVKNYSLFLDLTIILHTVEIVILGKGH